MQAIATIEQERAPAALKAVKAPRISKALTQAIDLLASGDVKTQKEAAERVNLTPEHLCRMLAKPHVRGVMLQRANENLARGQLRASARIVELLDAASEHVSLDASKHVLAIGGIRPPDSGQVSVNVGVSVGYVIDLTPMHAHTPQAPNTVQVIDNVDGGE